MEHPRLNAPLTLDDALTGSSKIVWWRGACGHVWRESIAQRTVRIDATCPYCSNRKLLPGFNDIVTLRTDLAAEFHVGHNGDLDASHVKVNSCTSVWWLGQCGHVWQARPSERN